MNSKDFFSLILSEQLILFSVDQDGRTGWSRAASWLWLDYGVRGAVLQELVDRKKIKLRVEQYNQLRENIIEMAGTERLEDLVLDKAAIDLAEWLKQYQVTSFSPRAIATCIFDNPFKDICLIFHQRLLKKGILHIVRRRLLGIIPWTKDFVVTDGQFAPQLKQIINENLSLPLSADQPLTKLLLLATASRLDYQGWLPIDVRGKLSIEINTLLASQPIAEATARAIAQRENVPSL